MRFMKYFTTILLAGLVLGFSSCNPELVQEEEGSSYNAYQKAVIDLVNSEKKSNKVILLVAFGSTWQQAFDAYDATIDAYKAEFPDYDVFLSFSSHICINRAAAGENLANGAEIRHYYAPPFWFKAFAQKGIMYKEIVVQSLQIIPTQGYADVNQWIKDFANNADGDLDDDYLSQVSLKLGVPLLQDPDKDIPNVARELDKLFKDRAANDLVVFVGKGTTDERDIYYHANVRFVQLEKALQGFNPHYFVGTLEMPENYMTHVYQRMVEAGFAKSNLKVWLHPLLAVNGDQAHNDINGDYVPEKWVGRSYDLEDLMEEADNDGYIDDCSWKVFFGAIRSGFTCNNTTVFEKGLLELPTIRQVWMDHTRDAINGKPLDYYHAKDTE